MTSLNLPLDPVAPLPSTVQLHHGDCLEVMPALDPGSAAMVFCDIPYGSTRNLWDKYINIDQLWQQIWRVMSASGPAIFTATQPFSSLLVTSQLRYFNSDIVWHKTMSTGFFSAKKAVLRAHEHVLIFRKKTGTYNPQFTEGPPTAYARRAGSSTNWGEQKELGRYDSGGKRYPKSVVTFKSREISSGPKRTLHPTQKPVALLEWLIKTYTNEGDTVLDPVAGSGTTAIAALRTGRNVVCIEKDPAYFEVMRKRIADEQARLGFEVTA